jgi:hypothetical protein
LLVHGGVAPRQSLALGNLSTADSVAANVSAVVTRHASAVAVAVTTSTMACIEIQMSSWSMSNNNQPTWTQLTYITDLPVGFHHFLTKIPETELGECPESESGDKEEHPSKRFNANPLAGDGLWTTRSYSLKDGEPGDISDDFNHFPVGPIFIICREPPWFVLET